MTDQGKFVKLNFKRSSVGRSETWTGLLYYPVLGVARSGNINCWNWQVQIDRRNWFIVLWIKVVFIFLIEIISPVISLKKWDFWTLGKWVILFLSP
jgi:hypothetical protein